MSQAREFKMPGQYPRLSPDDGEVFYSGESDSPSFRTLEVVQMELSQKRALLECLPQEDTHPDDFEILQAQIFSLQEEFKKLTMDQHETEMAELLQAYNSSNGRLPTLDAPPELGLHLFNPILPQQDHTRKRPYSQLDQSTQDNQLENLRRLAGPSHTAPHPQLLYAPSAPFVLTDLTSLGGIQNIDAINNGMYLPVTQISAPSSHEEVSRQQQISSDEGIARALQKQEVIDLTGDDDDDYDPAALSAAYQRFVPNQYARAGPSSENAPTLENPQLNNSIPRVEPELRNFSSGALADWSFYNEDRNLMIQNQHIPLLNVPRLGVSDNPIVLNDDDDDNYGTLNEFTSPLYGFAHSSIQQFGRPFPQSQFPYPSYLNNTTRNVDPNTLYNDIRHRAKDEQEDVKKLLEHLSDDTENKHPSDRLQTPLELTIKLMEHQKIGLTWLVKQEESGNKGGILADDMGLGKTIQAIALIVHRKSSNPHHKTTLIVCPVALMAQWQREIQVKVKAQHTLSTHIYHGTQPKRLKNFNALKDFDVVLTSYGTIAGEFKKKMAWIAEKRTRFPANEFPFLSSESTWYRVILDESQHVKNHRTLASRACTDLMASYRLCLSGTPMQNNIDDLFGAVRFLHLARYREFRTWNADFGSKIKLGKGFATDAMQRLRALIKAIMLRRKKDSLIDGAPLLILPPKNIELIHPVFGDDEQEIYNAVEQKVQLRFNKYIENGSVLRNYTYVLLLLLRLRQVCCHPKMIKDLSVKITDEEKELQINLINQLDPGAVERLKADPAAGCPICLDSSEKMKIISPCGHCFCEDCLTNQINQAMANGDEGNQLSCPVCRGPLNPSSLIDWHVFREIHIPEDSGLQQELEGIGNQLDNVLGGQLSSKDSDSDSDSDSDASSGSDSDDEGSDLGGFIVSDDEVESDTDGDFSNHVRKTRSRFSPMPPAGARREPRPSRQNGVKKEEETEDDFAVTQNSTASSSSGLKSEDDLPDDIWEEFKVKRQAKEEHSRNSSQSVEDESADVKPKAKKEGKKKKASGNRKEKRKKPTKSKKAKGKQKKEKRVLNLSDKRALAVRNKKARKKYFRELAKDWHSSAKIEKVREILRRIRENDPSEKTIIFSSFTSFLDLLSIPLTGEDKFDCERYDGSMTAKDRNNAVLNFTENPDVTVMLVSLKAGNSGLNLTIASHVIIIDPWWNPYVEEQAIDRAHRIGQERPVFVHRLIIVNTVEDRILKLQEQKREIISAAMDEDAIKGLNRLSVNDLMYLFTGSRDQ
ncbi:uncharacterized protein DFL_005043 [Arthrobotrys flagrans]|uniref:RING-type domain-containing protein n=1 Tax=Arthrobotrys flagrans TaxID=97331 RepID=A0A437A6L8_ARTFL|nr:hypothetical protein DFL_005043 [Arthrobotrys flagrans]